MDGSILTLHAPHLFFHLLSPPPFHFSLIFHRGAVFAMTLSQSTSPLFLLAYMWARGLHKQTGGGWSWESLVDWWTFTKLAIPGLLMVGFEWWSYEVGIIVVGTIDKTQLGIYIIVLNIATNMFMVSHWHVCVCISLTS